MFTNQELGNIATMGHKREGEEGKDRYYLRELYKSVA
jgi:hypothetical protein